MITGSLTAGIFLSQLMYWYSKMNRPFYKTDEEFADELCMTKKEVRGAKEYIKKLPFIKTKMVGVPPKTQYHVDFDSYVTTMKRLVEQGASGGVFKSARGGTLTALGVQYTTETTTKTTTKKDGGKPPTLEDVVSWAEGYARKKNLSIKAHVAQATKAWHYYERNRTELNAKLWKDGNGMTVKNWKLKIINNWFKNIPPPAEPDVGDLDIV